MAELLPVVILMMAVGAFAGVLAGLLGVGGGIVLVPAFFYAFAYFGYDNPQIMQICLATSLATIVVTSLRSVHAHNKKGAVDWDILRGWAIGIAIGALIGVWIVAGLRSDFLVGVFGVLAIIVGLYMGFGKPEWRLGDGMPTGPLRIILAPILGFFSVLMGIGGGSFGVPLLTLYGQAIHRAVATAAGFGVIIAVPSVLGFLLGQPPEMSLPPYMLGYVHLPTFALVIVMTFITTPFGVSLAHRLNVKMLRRVFAVFLVLVALNMLRQVI